MLTVYSSVVPSFLLRWKSEVIALTSHMLRASDNRIVNKSLPSRPGPAGAFLCADFGCPSLSVVVKFRGKGVFKNDRSKNRGIRAEREVGLLRI